MKWIITKINALSALIALNCSYGNPYQLDPRVVPGALQHISISVQISTFFARKAEKAGVVVVLEENMVSVSAAVIHISLILDFFQLICSS